MEFVLRESGQSLINHESRIKNHESRMSAPVRATSDAPSFRAFALFRNMVFSSDGPFATALGAGPHQRRGLAPNEMLDRDRAPRPAMHAHFRDV